MNNQLGRLSFGQNWELESEGTLLQQTLGTAWYLVWSQLMKVRCGSW